MRRWQSQQGNVAVMAAILIFPIVLIMGGGMDVVRATTIRVAMQQALDAAVLAAAPLNQAQDAEEAVQEYFYANIYKVMDDAEDVALSVSSLVELDGKTVTATANYSYTTLFLSLVGMQSIDIGVESGGKQGWQNLEISLVLDVSGSMNNSGKIGELRNAAEDFIDIVLTEDVKDMTTVNVVPFATHVNVGNELNEYIDPDEIDTNKDNNFSDGHRLTGCLNMRPDDYSMDAFTLESLQPLPEYQSYRICPSSTNQSLFISNDSSALTTKVKNLNPESCPACYTSIDEGTAIGLKALNPAMRGSFSGTLGAEVPRDFEDGVVKAIVIMSDGNMVKSKRPVNCWHWNDYYIGYYEPYWTCSETPLNQWAAEAKVRAMCEAALDEGIIVFTVGFGISSGSSADRLLSDCAGDSQHYFLVSSGGLEDAFSKIAGYIRAVRLIG